MCVYSSLNKNDVTSGQKYAAHTHTLLNLLACALQFRLMNIDYFHNVCAQTPMILSVYNKNNIIPQQYKIYM